MTGYNGYTNYETWLVKLWIDNNEGDHIYWLERAREHVEQAAENPDPLNIGSTELQTARYNLSEDLKNWHEDYCADCTNNLPPSLVMDMLGAAFASVDWHAIAEHMLNDVAEGVS